MRLRNFQQQLMLKLLTTLMKQLPEKQLLNFKYILLVQAHLLLCMTKRIKHQTYIQESSLAISQNRNSHFQEQIRRHIWEGIHF